MDLRAKREAYHEAKMNSRQGWNSSATEKNKGMDNVHALGHSDCGF